MRDLCLVEYINGLSETAGVEGIAVAIREVAEEELETNMGRRSNWVSWGVTDPLPQR